MDVDTINAVANVAGNVSSLAITLMFIVYLTRQLQRRDDLIFDDWKRQRDKELSAKDE